MGQEVGTFLGEGGERQNVHETACFRDEEFGDSLSICVEELWFRQLWAGAAEKAVQMCCSWGVDCAGAFARWEVGPDLALMEEQLV